MADQGEWRDGCASLPKPLFVSVYYHDDGGEYLSLEWAREGRRLSVSFDARTMELLWSKGKEVHDTFGGVHEIVDLCRWVETGEEEEG